MGHQNTFGIFKFFLAEISLVTQFAELGNAENFSRVTWIIIFDPMPQFKGDDDQDEDSNRHDRAIEKNL